MTTDLAMWVPLVPVVVSTIVTWVLFILANRRKVLGYAITTNAPLVTIKDEVHAKQIEILYHGMLVTDLRSIQVTIQNIGTKDIEDQGVDCIFPSYVLLMNFQVEFEPPTFQKSATVQTLSANHIQIHHALINPGDKTVFSALTANNNTGDLQIHARGPNLKFKTFDPNYFVSPTVNKGAVAFALVSFCGSLLILESGNAYEWELSWRSTFMLTLYLVLGIPFALASYLGYITAARTLQRRMGWIARLRGQSS